MNILIVGTGYAGLVTGACFADLGVNVTCVDSDARKINLLLYGGLPIYEQGLEAMVKRSVAARRLNFTSNFAIITLAAKKRALFRHIVRPSAIPTSSPCALRTIQIEFG